MAAPATEAIPVVDLRLLSQAELNSLALSSPNSFDLRRCDDVVVPKIDRSVFNESAGSRKQTYSRLRLAPHNPNPSAAATSIPVGRGRPRKLLSNPSPTSAAPSPSPAASAAAEEEDENGPGRRENLLIVSYLRQLFARQEPSPQIQALTISTTPVSTSATTAGGDGLVTQEHERAQMTLVVVEDKNRDQEVLNGRGETVDLLALGEKVDPFEEELRRKTAGLTTEEQLLAFMGGLNGQWGSRRRRRRIVDASEFGNHLPRGWKLLLALKRKDGDVWLYSRRYVSPSGKYFASCKEVSSFILSLIGQHNAMPPISVENDGSDSRLDKMIPCPPGPSNQENNLKETQICYSAAPLSFNSADNETQNLAVGEMNNVLEYKKCNLTYSDKDAYLLHQLSVHQRSVKRRKLGKLISEGVIVKDGKFECQFCQKTFTERHRYNGHIGAHVRYQGLTAESLSDEISSKKIYNPTPLAAVPFAISDMAAPAEQKSEPSTLKSADELQATLPKARIEGDDHEVDHGSQHMVPEATSIASLSKFDNDLNGDGKIACDKSEEIVQLSMGGKSFVPKDIGQTILGVKNVTQEDSTNKSLDDQFNNTFVMDKHVEDISEPTYVKDAKPNYPLDTDFNMTDYKSEYVSEAGGIVVTGCMDVITNMTDYKSEDVSVAGKAVAAGCIDAINNMTDDRSEDVSEAGKVIATGCIDAINNMINDYRSEDVSEAGKIIATGCIDVINNLTNYRSEDFSEAGKVIATGCMNAISNITGFNKSHFNSDNVSDASKVSAAGCMDTISNTTAYVAINSKPTIEMTQPSSACISVGENMANVECIGFKPEDAIEVNKDFGTESSSCINPLSSSLDNVDKSVCENPNEENVAGCTLIPDIQEYGQEQKLDSENQLIILSGNVSSFAIESYSTDILNSTVEENVLVEMDTSRETNFFGSHSFLGKDMVNERTVLSELDANCMDIPLIDGHNNDTETNAGSSLDFVLKESMLEEMDRPVNLLDNCFHSGRIGGEVVSASDAVQPDDGSNSLLVNLTLTSPWLNASDSISMVGTLPDQRTEDTVSAVGQRHENLSGFEQLRMDAGESSEFVGPSTQESITEPEPPVGLDYMAELGNASCASVQLGWGLPLTSSRCQLTSVCVWCSREFSHQGYSGIEDSDSLGFICPTCKVKISGHF